MTQISGSLVALEGLILHGWVQDGSKISPTHPSPTLRFRLVWRAWLEILTNSNTWTKRNHPGALGLDNFALWFIFEKWCAGANKPKREGGVWYEEMELVRRVLERNGPQISNEKIYVRNSEGLFRVPSRYR